MSKTFTDGTLLERVSWGHVDEMRVLQTRDLCCSESHSSQEHKRGGVFNRGTRTSQVGLSHVKDLREGGVKREVCCFSHQ